MARKRRIVLISLCLGALWYLVSTFALREKGVPTFQVVDRTLGYRILEKIYDERELRRVNLSSTLDECATRSENASGCPTMIQCRGALSKIAYCREDRFTDPEEVSLGYEQSEGHLFTVDDVIVNHKGDILDDQLVYDHGGCHGRAKVTYQPGTAIKSYSAGLNLAHIWGMNYYHLMGETLPRIFQVRQFILDHPDMPLFVKVGTSVKHILRILRLEHRAKVTFIDHSGVIHMNRTYVPLSARCGRSSHAVWRNFKRFLFTRSIPEILEEVRPMTVKRLKIVVAERTQSRRIEGFAALIEKLLQRTQGEVVVFKGNEGLDGTLRMFSDAALFLGSHGAGLTNMAFMPDNGVVLELLPDRYLNHCFGQLAVALGLEYHMILGSGDKETPIVVVLDLVVDKVVELAARFSTSGS